MYLLIGDPTLGPRSITGDQFGFAVNLKIVSRWSLQGLELMHIPQGGGLQHLLIVDPASPMIGPAFKVCFALSNGDPKLSLQGRLSMSPLDLASNSCQVIAGRGVGYSFRRALQTNFGVTVEGKDVDFRFHKVQ